jgi:sugar phosphate isomerase/epimerase
MHHRISVSSICFVGTPFAALAEIWRRLGVRKVSLVTQQVDEAGIEAIGETLAAGGLELENVSHLFMPGRHFGEGEAAWGEARERLDRLIGETAALGGQSIYMLTGGHGRLQWEEAAHGFAEAIAPCVPRAREAGIGLMIENAPPLYADLHLAHSLRDTLTLAEMAGIGLCIDLIGCWAEAGLRDTIQRALPRCGLVQVSDYVYGDRAYPCRAVVGDGVIDYEGLIGDMLAGGYQGTFDLELIGPRIEAEGRVEAVTRCAANLGDILRRFGA